MNRGMEAENAIVIKVEVVCGVEAVVEIEVGTSSGFKTVAAPMTVTEIEVEVEPQVLITVTHVIVTTVSKALTVRSGPRKRVSQVNATVDSNGIMLVPT